VKRALAWFAGLLGIAALGRWLAARHRQPAASGPEPQESEEAPATDPAEELRRKLADARGGAPVADAADQGDQADEAAPAEETLEERRARVHAKAREAIDAMADEGGAA
jgi:hypothetical protein